jgi:hypothetical protein
MREHAMRQGISTRAKVVIALLAGLVVLLYLVPSGGVDTQPPRCDSIFGLYSVPCEGWVAPVVAAATAAVVYLLLWLRDRRR